MELWLTFIALYAWQCLVWLRVPSAVFGPRWLGADDLQRTGVQALSPWPSTLGAIASPIPFALVSNDCDADAIVLRRSDDIETAPPLALDGLELERRGAKVVAHGRAILVAPSKTAARHWCTAIAAVANAAPAERTAVYAREIGHSLDADALRDRLTAARRATRWLGLVCDVDLLFLLAGVPALGLLFGSEYALAISLPALAGLHVLGVVLAFFVHRRLFPDRRGERAEELFMAALYPPALLRRPAAWVDAAVTGFHPLAWARVALPENEAKRVWMRERARLEGEAARRSDESPALCAEREAIEARWPSTWSQPQTRARVDPLAESYCPVCWDDFRSGFDHCRSCNAETIPYEKAAS